MNKWIKYSTIIVGIIAGCYGMLCLRFYYGAGERGEHFLTSFLRNYPEKTSGGQPFNYLTNSNNESQPFYYIVIPHGSYDRISFPDGVNMDKLIPYLGGKIKNLLTRQEYYIGITQDTKNQDAIQYQNEAQRDQPLHLYTLDEEDFLGHPHCNFFGFSICSPVDTVLFIFGLPNQEDLLSNLKIELQ